MSRKSASFSQLYEYLTREEENFCFSRNTYSNIKNKKELLQEFYNNAEYLKQSRGNVYLYHELLSLEQNNLSKLRQKEILLDLANRYLEQRADNHLSFGVIHEDKEHIHLHLMISANEIESKQRVRLSKPEFASIQQKMEQYKNENYIELKPSSLYQKQKANSAKQSQKEQEMRQRRKATTIKEEIKQNLEIAFKQASSSAYIKNHLENLEYELYMRGNTMGVKHKGKKYRLKTLGLEEQYNKMMIRLEKIEQRERNRQTFKQRQRY